MCFSFEAHMILKKIKTIQNPKLLRSSIWYDKKKNKYKNKKKKIVQEIWKRRSKLDFDKLDFDKKKERKEK